MHQELLLALMPSLSLLLQTELIFNIDLSLQVLIEGSFNSTFVCAIIEHDYITIIKVSVLQVMGISTVGKA